MARTVKCPGCGADLTVKDGNRDFMFCEYCGTKVRLDDYQETHRYVNEAEVKKVEAEKEIKLKQMEIDEKGEKKALIVLGIMGGIGILFMLVGRFL